MQKSSLKLGRYDWAVFSGFFSHAFGLQMLPVILLAVSNELGFPLAKGGFSKGGMIAVFMSITTALGTFSCGYLASKFGKRHAFAGALILLLVGIFSLSWAKSYEMYIVFLMIAGAGGGIILGLAPAVAHDLHPEDGGKYITIGNSFWSAGMLGTVLFTGYLLGLGYEWRSLVFVGGCTVVVPVVFTLLPHKNACVFPDSSKKTTLIQVVKMKTVVLGDLKFWRFIILLALSTGAEMTISAWTASYVQLGFRATAEAGGFAVGCFATGMIISRFCSGYFVKQAKIKYFILGFAAAGAVVGLTIPMIKSLELFYVVLFVFGLTVAPLWPFLQSYGVDELKKYDKTITLSMLTISGTISFAVFSWITGSLATYFGRLNPVYFIIPINYSLLVLVLLLKRKS